MKPSQSIEVNGRRYQLPTQPTVVVCIDGCEPDYLGLAVAAGVMPWMKSTLENGFSCVAQSAMPSFTNPNNLSIVTGVTPSVHGICGNYLFDSATQREVMMNDPTWLRAPTLLAALAREGKSVAVVTAKDKLRLLLGHGLQGICFSAEKADQAEAPTHGIGDVLQWLQEPLPNVYSAELSEFTMKAGVRLMQDRRPDVMYLSTTDYVQHKYAPGTPEANAFYAMLDLHLKRLEQLGCVIAVTADHGMHAKFDMNAKPCVFFLQEWLDAHFPNEFGRVVLPITDPYVRHHGALGSFATVYLSTSADIGALCIALSAQESIETALPRAEAAVRYELPADRIGEIVVVAKPQYVIGTSADLHDMTELDAPLRSHGGTSEQCVPLILNRKLRAPNARRKWRNFDAFELALNVNLHEGLNAPELRI